MDLKRHQRHEHRCWRPAQRLARKSVRMKSRALSNAYSFGGPEQGKERTSFFGVNPAVPGGMEGVMERLSGMSKRAWEQMSHEGTLNLFPNVL